MLSNMSIVFSSVCVLHCLLTPFFILLLPALAEFFSDTIEFALIMAVVPLSLLGFLPAWLKHKNYALLRYFILGLSLVLVSQLFIHTAHDSLVTRSSIAPNLTYIKSVVMFLGASILAFAVYKNNKHTHVCNHKH